MTIINNMLHRRTLLAISLLGGGLLILAFLAGSELFMLRRIYNADTDVEKTLPRLVGGEATEIVLDRVKPFLRTSSLAEPEVDRSRSPKEILMESPHNQTTSKQAATDIEARHTTPKPELAEIEQKTRTEVVAVGVVQSNTAGPTPVEVDDTPRPSTKSTNVADTGSPRPVDIHAVAKVEVFPSTPSPVEANDILWALIVHFTGKLDRFKAVTSTWLKRTHPRMAFVIFTSEKSMAAMNSSGIPTVYYPQNESMTDHTLQAIRSALAMFPNAVYISKSDDDAYVYTQRLAHTLFSNVPYNYQGLKCPAQNRRLRLGNDFIYACGGLGYTLTRYAAEKLVNLSNPPSYKAIEDVGVGLRMKFALGKEFGLHAIDVHWDDSRDEWKEQPQKAPPLSYHYVTPSVMNMMHEEAYHWRPVYIRRSPIPRIFHHLESEPIHHSCTDINPKWKIMTWTTQTIKELSKRSQNDSTFVQYDALYRHGGIYLSANDTCKEPLDARLDRFAEDFEHDGYYLAYDFHEYGFRSGLFVMRPLSDASNSLHYFAESNRSSLDAAEHLKSSRTNIAVLPATGLFEKR